MKRFLSLLIAAALIFSCFSVGASAPFEREAEGAAVPEAAEEGLVLYPASLLLPMFSFSTGERLRVFFDGESVPAYMFSWSSSDPGVVTVDQAGNLTAVAPGFAVITVSDGDESAESAVTVVDDDASPRLQDLEPVDLELPFYSEEIGIGPLAGAEPVVLKRYVVPPSCGGDPEPDPNAFLVSQGWTYTYAVIYKFNVHYGQSFRFETGPSAAPGAHASNAYVCVYDCFFNLWEYSGGTSSNPYGSVTFDSYEENYFYLVIFPMNHTNDAASGNIRLYAYDIAQPYIPGDTNGDRNVTMADVTSLIAKVMNAAELSYLGNLGADANGDGNIDILDASAIYSIVFGG